MAALDMALEKLQARMRKAADRRRVHHGSRTPVSVAQATAANGVSSSPEPPPPEEDPAGEHKVGPLTVVGDGPLVVREKTHQGAPMTLDQALYEMELVGHDFFLFLDKESECPSVVYRRRGYDYGVITLDVQ
jgi:hypothetical protein